MTDAVAGRGATVLAVDVGGTGIKGARVAVDGAVVQEAHRPTPRGTAAVVAAVREVVAELAASGPVRAVGVGVPGEIDAERGVARYAANLAWRDVPVTALTDGLVDPGVPVVLDHDVRSAARAELAVGALRGVNDATLLVLGTGIAGVSVCAGALVTGARGLAGEVGHLPVHPGGEPCPCGQTGCLEVYASAGGIARRYAAATGTARPTHEVVAAVDHDEAAARVWSDAVEALALGCITLTLTTDPAVIALGGGLAGAGATLLDPLRDRVAVGLTWRPAPVIALSRLGATAGRTGIALRAWDAAGVTVDDGTWAPTPPA